MIFIVIFLFIISFIFALNSLRNLMGKKEVEKVKKELKKGRVIYQDSSSADSSSSSSESSSS